VPMSGPKSCPEVEVIASTRRRWTMGERRAILGEADQDGVTVSEVARRHGLSPSLLFRWRRQFKKVRPKSTTGLGFVPLALPAPAPSPNEQAAASLGGDRIEIVLGGGRRLIVGKDVDVAALGRILDVLERR
jgi:transposase